MMLGARITLVFTSVFLFLNPVVFGGWVIPCNNGSGVENGCGGCDQSKKIGSAAWFTATPVTGFNLPGAAAKLGGGYDVW